MSRNYKTSYTINRNITEEDIRKIVDIHLLTFQGFFLSSLGTGFLKSLYRGFKNHKSSGLILLKSNNEEVIGFLAYSKNIKEFYKWLLKSEFLSFVLYSFLATLRNPKVGIRLLRALTYSKTVNESKNFIELSSIGIHPDFKNQGFGSILINEFIDEVKPSKNLYIRLTTDAVNNDLANAFYKKNGFKKSKTYTTQEGRIMNEYRFYGDF